jgi:hypothetical protein
MVVTGVHDLVTVHGHVASPLECHGGLAGAWDTTEYRQVSGTKSSIKDSIEDWEPSGNGSNSLDASLEILDNVQSAAAGCSAVGPGHANGPLTGLIHADFTACS